MIKKIVSMMATSMILTSAAFAEPNPSSTLTTGGRDGRAAQKSNELQKVAQPVATCTNVRPSDALRPVGKRDFTQRDNVCSRDFSGPEVSNNNLKK